MNEKARFTERRGSRCELPVGHVGQHRTTTRDGKRDHIWTGASK